MKRHRHTPEQVVRKLREGEVVVEAWRIEYNTYRPHGSLGGLTPAEYAVSWTTQPQPVLPCLLDR